MGNTEQRSFTSQFTTLSNSTQFISQLTYIQNCAPFGQIYRMKDPPYDYIMKNRRFFTSNDPLLMTYRENIAKIANDLQHKNLAQIHFYKVNTQLQMCGIVNQVDTYYSHYQITLDQVIKKRRRDDVRFTQNQIWYVLKNLLEVSILVRKKVYNFGDYRSSRINLSSQGYLKIYVFRSQRQSPFSQNETQYTNAMNNRGQILQNLPLPPEFLPSLKIGHMFFVQDFQKQDSFMIGTVLLQMLIDEDIKKYYSFSQQNFFTFKTSEVKKDIKLLSNFYNKTYLLNLLQRMLEEDPKKRITTQQALDFINKNRDNINIGASVKMFEDEQNHIQPKMSYRTIFDFDSHILKSIQPNILQIKLTACPIKTLTKDQKQQIGVSLTSSKNQKYFSSGFSSGQKKYTGLSIDKNKTQSYRKERGSSLTTRVGRENRP